MPELPEVETIRRQLEKALVGKKISETEVSWAGRLNVGAGELKKGTEGAKIVSVRRRAKLLMIGLSNGNAVAVHLGMTGRLLVSAPKPPSSRHVFVVFRFAGGQLAWEDYRRFGFMKLLDAQGLEKYLAGQEYGPEPLPDSFGTAEFSACLSRRPKKKIKEALMDQTVIAGIGNIYAAEALWLGRIAPDRRVGSLSRAEIAALLKGIKKALSDSIASGGTSADDYVDANGEKGTNSANLKVYGRDGKPCPRRDGGTVKKETLGGRGTYWCPACQA